ncbi:MAG: outer membrane beta-barrel protein [Prevotella sp.]|nr:outer membrane beta-barrel protein [Prevotella sp.]
MKKIFMLITALMLTLHASAQFEQGKVYAGASLSGLDLSYNGSKELSFGVSAKGGYFFADNLMLLGELGYNHAGKDITDYFSAGLGGRYYITQNGIFLGANAKYIHAGSYNDLMPGVEVGYAFFVSHTVTIEPSIYYQQSFKDHSDYSTIGLKIGVGVYLGR